MVRYTASVAAGDGAPLGAGGGAVGQGEPPGDGQWLPRRRRRGRVSSIAEVGSVAPATRQRKKVPACQLFSTPKTSAPRKAVEWGTRSPAAPSARDSIVPSATLWTVSSTPPFRPAARCTPSALIATLFG